MPIDVVKVRMQLQGELGSVAKYKSSLHAFPVIVREEGVAGLYKGERGGWGTGATGAVCLQQWGARSRRARPRFDSFHSPPLRAMPTPTPTPHTLTPTRAHRPAHLRRRATRAAAASHVWHAAHRHV